MACEWKSMAEKPTKQGAYPVYAESADPDMPFRYIAYYRPGAGWYGIVPYWLKALTHWLDWGIPETEGQRLEEIQDMTPPKSAAEVILELNKNMIQERKMMDEDLPDIIHHLMNTAEKGNDKKIY